MWDILSVLVLESLLMKGSRLYLFFYLTGFCYENVHCALVLWVFSVILTVFPVYHLVLLNGKATDVIHW